MKKESKHIRRLLVFLILCAAQIRGWTIIHTKKRPESRINRYTLHSNSDDNIDILDNLHKLLSPSDNCQVDQMSSTDLAYVGDAVYELLIRTTKVWPSKRTSDLQSQVVSIVRGTSLVSAWRSLFVSNQAVLHLDIAEFQATLLKSLKESFELNDKEHQILNRGRNSVSKSNRRDPAAYQDATALEALIGYLYITNTPRCSQLLGWIQNTIGDSNELS